MDNSIISELIDQWPKITIIGKDEIIIENHNGIEIFGKNDITIITKVGRISLYGDDFKIVFMSGGTIVINGIIKKVEFENNGK